jgi:type I restriction enzyme S subunit
MLSVYRDYGVVPREGREDNYNKPGEDLGAYRVVQRGDLVLNKMKTWQGSLGISRYDGIVSPAYFVARPLTDDCPEFLHHLLRSKPLIAEYAARSKGIRPSQWDLPWEEFRDIIVDLPPSKIQRRIADYLDRETVGVDALIAAKRRMLELLREQFQACIDSELVAPQWPIVPLRRLLKLPPQYGAIETGVIGPADWPRYIRITDLASDGSLVNDGVQRLPPTVAAPFMLTVADLLVARSGATVGKSFIYRSSMEPAAFAGYLIRLRFDSRKVLPDIVYLWMQSSHYWQQLRATAIQATIENVSAERYKEMRVPLPPLKLQSDIVARLSRRRGHLRAMTSRLEHSISLLQEHRGALITAAITGQLEIPESA